MIHKIYSIRDAKTDMYGKPFYTSTDGDAIRSVEKEVNNPDKNNMLFTNTEDFSLWSLGAFDDQDGIFITTSPKILVNCDQLKKGMLTQAGHPVQAV